MKNITIETVKFVEVSTIVPECWKDWFFNDISENAPFSWGDNNRTLVSSERFMDHAEYVLNMVESGADDDQNYILNDIKEYRPAFLDTLSHLEAEQIYIDLEN